MAKNLELNVRATGLNALAQPNLSLPVGEKIFIGALIGVKDGKIMLADKTKKIEAIGIAIKELGTREKEDFTAYDRISGKYLAIEQIVLIEHPEVLQGIKKSDVKIGQNIYLDTEGTITKTSGSQIVGKVVDNVNRVAVQLFPSGFDIV